MERRIGDIVEFEGKKLVCKEAYTEGALGWCLTKDKKNRCFGTKVKAFCGRKICRARERRDCNHVVFVEVEK